MKRQAANATRAKKPTSARRRGRPTRGPTGRKGGRRPLPPAPLIRGGGGGAAPPSASTGGRGRGGAARPPPVHTATTAVQAQYASASGRNGIAIASCVITS